MRRGERERQIVSVGLKILVSLVVFVCMFFVMRIMPKRINGGYWRQVNASREGIPEWDTRQSQRPMNENKKGDEGRRRQCRRRVEATKDCK